MKAILILILSLILVGCASVKPAETEVIYRDKIEYRYRLQKDTTYVHDSIFVRQKADTFFVDRWHTKYVERTRMDTTYVSKTDSVYVTKTEYIRKRNAYDKFTSCGFWLLLALIVLTILIRRVLKTFNIKI